MRRVCLCATEIVTEIANNAIHMTIISDDNRCVFLEDMRDDLASDEAFKKQWKSIQSDTRPSDFNRSEKNERSLVQISSILSADCNISEIN